MIVFILALSLLPLTGACSERKARTLHGYDLCQRGVRRLETGVLRICDQLNEAVVSQAISQLRDDDTEVLLTSGGGVVSAAITLVEALNARHITVRVRQFCLSACSTDVLLAAEKVVVEPHTIVAFHHTGAFAAEVMADRSGMSADSPFRQQATREREFFEREGLDPDLLNQIAMSIEPICMGIRRQGSGRERYLNFRKAWFVPDRIEADRMFRGRLSGYWPASGSQAQAILRPTLGDGDLTVSYGPLASSMSPAKMAAQLPVCPGSLPGG
ncbi:hypothetical protein RM53_16770 [Brevundimonas nasdae]|uniref:Clp protease n=1 Tax=Brevundimonas nasdae TaxID=172043 RepID=A0A0B4DCR1_9CAUL|nr:hypothetical protein RM53_16770 [Brevundimonas nasdae]